MSRKALLLLLLPLVLIIAGYFYIRYSLQSAIKKEEAKTGVALPTPDTLGAQKTSAADLRPLFIKRLQLLLKSSSANLYDLSVKDLSLDVFSSSVTLQGVKLTPNEGVLDSLRRLAQLPSDVYSVTFDSLRIEGVNLDDAITSKTMDYRLVKLVRPVIVVRHKREPVKKDVAEKEDFAQRFLAQMQKLAVKNLVIEDGTVSLYNDTKKEAPLKLKNVDIKLDNILLDSVTRRDKRRFLFAEQARLSFDDYNRPTPDGLYNMKIGSVSIQEPERKVVLKNFSFTSPLSRSAFSARQTKSKELYNLRLPSVSVSNVDWWTLLNEEEIVADAVDVPGGNLSIYLDRSLPPKNKMGNFPNQLLMKLPFKLAIDAISLRNLDFSYAEYNPVSQQTGTMYMSEVGLQLSNVSNLRTNTKPVVARGTARFMRQVPVKANFIFDKKAAASGAFSATISAPGFDGTIVNSFAPAMGLVKVERGTIQKIEASLRGNERAAAGTGTLLYKDLKLHLLEKDKGEKVLDKKGFTTFAANLFLLKNDNPKGREAPRRANVNFDRIPEGGFFMLVWKTLLTGVLQIVGAPEKIARKTIAGAKKKE